MQSIISLLFRLAFSCFLGKFSINYRCQVLLKYFIFRGMSGMGIHGDKSQSQRSQVIQKFKAGRCNIMIATDVAARGLDISNVEYVINYDFPNDIESYVHRIGRTGRSNNKGTAVTFVSDDDANSVPKLIKVLKEANQEIPEELINLSRYASKGKQQNRRYGGGGGYNKNNSFSSYNKRNQFNNYQRSSNFDRDDYDSYDRNDRSTRYDGRSRKNSYSNRSRYDDNEID